MRTIFAAILLSILASNTFAADEHKLRAEVAYGQCHYERSAPGTWWQPDHENHSTYKDNCGELGVSWSFNRTFGVALRYVSLGRVHTRALAQTMPRDDESNKRNVDLRRAECQPSFNEDNCLYQWWGDGGIEPGFNLSVTAQIARLGPVSFETEAGALLYRLTWNEQVYPLGCEDGGCPWRMVVDQRSNYFLSPMVGATVRFWDHFFIATRYYMRTSQHTPVTAGFGGSVQTWLIGMQKTF